MSVTGGKERRTQEERSATTRAALLDATIECLVEHGYAGTTTSRVAERAGLSRGAHLHHFQTRAALVAAAVEWLGTRRTAEFVEQLEALGSGGERVPEALDLLWRLYTTPLFYATFELAAAARTDPELRSHLAPVERTLNRETYRLGVELFPEFAGRSDFGELLDVVLSTIRGLAMLKMLQPGDTRLERRWKAARDRLIEVFEAGEGRVAQAA
jgi:AcrR family transcriptional regulator